MALDIDQLLALWTGPYDDRAAAEEAFARVYADPVLVNGSPLRILDLVARADALRTALTDVRHEVLDVCHAEDKVVVAFRITGRHVGPFATSAGVLPATGREIALRVIDVLTLTDGRISSLWMVADELGALVGLEAVSLRPRRSNVT
jgi:predicted ester cyclase